jgi:hypothetical protein
MACKEKKNAIKVKLFSRQRLLMPVSALCTLLLRPPNSELIYSAEPIFFSPEKLLQMGSLVCNLKRIQAVA